MIQKFQICLARFCSRNLGTASRKVDDGASDRFALGIGNTSTYLNQLAKDQERKQQQQHTIQPRINKGT